MADFGIAEAAALVSALGAAAGAGTGIASAVRTANAPKAPSLPTAMPQDNSQIAKALLPAAKADAAARSGGGISPDFLANIIGQQAGTPGAGLDIIGDIRNSLGQAP